MEGALFAFGEELGEQLVRDIAAGGRDWQLI